MSGSGSTFVLVAMYPDAIKHAVAGAEKQTAKELDVDPKGIGKTLPETGQEV